MISLESRRELDEYAWKQLLEYIEQGKVIPIVGQDLLVWPKADGTISSLDSILAQRIARNPLFRLDGGTALPDYAALNFVASRFLRREPQRRQFLYAAVDRAVSAQDFPSDIPPVLLKLASIEPFHLFVTTTITSLVQRAVEEVRSAQGNAKVYTYVPEQPSDLPPEWSSLPEPIIYHLLGKVSPVPEFAITEEDVLEFVHSLQSETRRPENLFTALNQQHLLILGCSFPDWLGRFFIRLGKGDRLWKQTEKFHFVADDRTPADRLLRDFLEHFSPETWVFDCASTVAFVDELLGRWQARGDRPGESPAQRGSIFISYASEDRAVAEALAEALRAAGFSPWFDREELKGGDLWEKKIQQAVKESFLFVPLISRSTLTARDRFFRVEWELAEQRVKMMPRNARFIVPILLDDTSLQNPAFPATIQGAQGIPLPAGGMSLELLQNFERLFKEFQKSRQ